jgi:hypothetical protein
MPGYANPAGPGVDEPPTENNEPDSLAVLALLGVLAITAISGLLVLGILWLIGWPP